MLLALSIAVSRCNQAPDSPFGSQTTGSDELKVNNDGTALVTGTVLQTNQGCRVDTACYLLVKAGSKTVRVVYHPGEVEGQVNKSAYRAGSSLGKGARVTAYGRYRKRGDTDIIETFIGSGNLRRATFWTPPRDAVPNAACVSD